jgi:NADH-quinone oxidoreductase subunit C
VSRLSPEAEAPGTTATEEETPPPTARHGEIVEVLRTELGDGLVEHHFSAREAWVRVAPESWRAAGRISRERLGLGFLDFLSAIDWKQAPDLGAQKRWDPEAEASAEPGDGPGRWVTGVAGGETRFQVFARLYDVDRHVGLTLKVDAGDGEAGSAPRAESWVPLFRGADWHERETWEMYGIIFDGHPGLRHLYLPGEFEGYPLRKDFPLLAREVKPWPGLVNVEGLPGEDDATEGDATEGDEAPEAEA